MAEPGVVYVKKPNNAEEERFSLLKDSANIPVLPQMPPVKLAVGLSQEREKYLWKDIRPFLDEDKADLLAPRPSWLGVEMEQ